MARPKLNIDPGMVERMALTGNTNQDIALILRCSVDTLTRRFAEDLARGRAGRRKELRERMWYLAMHGNSGMMVWLSKQSPLNGGLEMTDKIETKVDATVAQAAPITKEAVLEAMKADKFLKFDGS